MMEILVDRQLSLKLFNKMYATEFFEAIRGSNATGDVFVEALQKKYASLEKVSARIKDAIENKFQIDGTPDFFIYFDSKIAGVFEFHPLSTGTSVEIGFWLFPEYRKNGILSKVFPHLVDYAARTFSREKIVATTAIENLSAQRLLERSGFIKNGETEEHLPDGTSEKQFVYELSLVK